MKRISHGYEINVNRKALSSDSPTTIYLHKLGCADSTWFRPDELRHFIKELSEALAEAENAS